MHLHEAVAAAPGEGWEALAGAGVRQAHGVCSPGRRRVG